MHGVKTSASLISAARDWDAAKGRADAGRLEPLLPTYLPAKSGLNAESGALLRWGRSSYQVHGRRAPGGDPAGLGQERGGQRRRSMPGRGGKGTLTLLMYPTPQIAGRSWTGDRDRHVNQEIGQRGPASLGTVKLRRVGPLVAMTSGALDSYAGRGPECSPGLHLNEEVSVRPEEATRVPRRDSRRRTTLLAKSICGDLYRDHASWQRLF